MPRAVLRPVWETSIDLRIRTRSSSWHAACLGRALHRGDWVYVDRELIRVTELPKGPDEDVSFASFRGGAWAFEDTSSEAHALGRPVYKVELHPPRATFSPNGLPLFTLTYRNDDGGPVWGKDSRLTFTAPAAGGDYIVRVRDARGEDRARSTRPGSRWREACVPTSTCSYRRPTPTCRAVAGFLSQ